MSADEAVRFYGQYRERYFAWLELTGGRNSPSAWIEFAQLLGAQLSPQAVYYCTVFASHREP